MDLRQSGAASGETFDRGIMPEHRKQAGRLQTQPTCQNGIEEISHNG